jgi:predicted DNA-binding transcriptional regulator AlpA
MPQASTGLSKSERRYARAKKLSTILDIPESSIWQMVRQGRLPAPIKFGPKHSLFNVADCIKRIEEAA